MSNLLPDPLFDNIKLVKLLRANNSPFLHNLHVIFTTVKELLNNRIPTVFPNYTLHDISHSIRIANYMYDLLQIDDNKDYHIGELDIVIMLYSAFLHDIGMVVSQEDLQKIQEDKHPTDIGYGYQLSNIKKMLHIPAEYSLQEFVRRTHSYRSRLFVNKEEKALFSIPDFPNTSFQNELALVCQSHNENYEWIKENLKSFEEKGNYKYNPQFCACMLRIADILDIDERRTPPRLYHSINPIGRSDEEWKQHFTITNAEKVVFTDGTLKLKFVGSCDNPNIHRKILHYLDWVQDEINGTKLLMQNFSSGYKLNIDSEIKKDITPIGYLISNSKMSIDYRAVSTLLMGEKIYGDKKYGLRELLQNSIDACKIRTETEKRKKYKWNDDYRPNIKIIIDRENRQIIIKDNGIGMTMNIINNHFLNIGKSYYLSDSFKLQGYEYIPIGGFGIGFLACYMLSKNVSIRTKHIDSNIVYELDLTQGEEYSCIKELNINNFEGTEIMLNYDEVLEVFEEEKNIQDFIEENILTGDINFYFIIENSVSIKTNLDLDLKGDTFNYIDVSKYLQNMEGVIALSPKPYLTYTTINDIFWNGADSFIAPFTDDKPFFYDGEKIIGHSDSLKEVWDIHLANLCSNGRLEYLNVVLKNWDTTRTRYDSLHISILYDNNKFNFNTDLEKDILSKLKDIDIIDYLSRYEKNTYVSFDKIYLKPNYISVYKTKNNEAIIPFLLSDDNLKMDDDDNLNLEFNSLGKWLYTGPSKEFGTVYNNSILVSNISFFEVWNPLACPQTGLDIFNFNINITDPLDLTVSRDSFYREKDVEELYYALIKAVHIAALDTYEFSPNEREVIKSFIKERFAFQSRFCKQIL